MANIGALAVQLTANARGLMQGLQTTAAAATSWSSRMAATAGKAGSALAGGLQAGASKAAGALGMMVKTLGLPALIGGGTLAGLFMVFKSGVNDILDTDRRARALGVSVNDLRAVMVASGPAAQAMEGALGQLALRMYDLRSGSTDTVRMFRGLGQQGGGAFGMSPEALGGQNIVQTFAQVAEKLKAIQDPTQRAAAAWKIFGDQYHAVLPILERGGNALGQGQDMARRFGLAVSPQEVATVRQVAETMGQIQNLKAGVTNQVTLGFAPIVAELTKLFDGLKLNISGIKDAIVDVAEAVAKAGAVIVAMWQDPKLFIAAWEVAFSAIGGLAKQAIGGVIEGIGKALKGTTLFGGQGLVMEGQGFLLQSQGALALAQSRKQAEVLAAQVKQTDPFQATTRFFQRVRGLMQQAGQAAKAAPPPAALAMLGNQFKGLRDAVRNPFESFRTAIADVNRMQGAGLFKGEQQGLQEGMAAKAFGNLASAVQLPTQQFAGAAVMNTRDAYSAMAQWERSQTRQTVQEQMKALLEEANRQQAEQVRIGQQVLEEIKRQKAPPVKRI